MKFSMFPLLATLMIFTAAAPARAECRCLSAQEGPNGPWIVRLLGSDNLPRQTWQGPASKTADFVFSMAQENCQKWKDELCH